MSDGIGFYAKRWGRYYLFAAFVAVVYWFRRVLVALATTHLTYLLIGIGILILLILVYLFFFFRSAKKKTAADAAVEEAEAPEPEPEEAISASEVAKAKLSSMRLRKIFSRALKVMRTNITGRDYRYRIPWVLMLGQSGSGKTSTLGQAGFKMPLGGPFGGRAGERDECKWWFLEKGAVIDASGDLVLGADGFSANDRLWSAMLRLLQKYRPERPIDGVVLTIPCEELIGKGGQDGPDLDQASRKADLLNKKLLHAQKVLGMRFPVYVLVTKCDQVTGFQSFCQNLPDDKAGNMFGWSSPHSANAAYTGEWVPQAFQRINRDLFENQFEMFAEGKQLWDPESLFLFPENLKALQAPLQIYLDRLFRQSVYHDSYLFRGLYFCGESGVDQVRSAPAKAYFLKELFDKKIFPEFRLARPQARALVSRNRAVIAAQVATLIIALVGGLGLWQAYGRLQDDKRAMVPVFRQIDRDFRALRQADKGPEGLLLYNALRHGSVSITFGKSAMNLFQGMTNFRSMSYLFIPSSWFSNIHGELRRSMTLAYDGIILKALYIELLQKAKAIFESTGQGSSGTASDPGEVVAIADTNEFIELKAFVDNLQELQQHADLYNSLRTSKNLKDLGLVVKYLFNLELPSGFYKNARYYHDALGQGDYRVFDPSIFKLKAKFFTLRKLTRNLYARLYNPNQVEVALQRLSFVLDKFARQRRRPTGEIRLIHEVLDTIDRTESQLGRSEFAWMFKDTFDLGEPFNQVMTAVEESGFLGPDLREASETAGQEAFDRLQVTLKDKQSILTGRLLALRGEAVEDELGDSMPFGEAEAGAVPEVDNEEFFADFQGADIVDINEPDGPIVPEADMEDMDEEPEFADDEDYEFDEDEEPAEEMIANRLSGSVVALKKELEQLLGQNFMAEDLGAQKDLKLPPGTRLRWDKNLLGEAVKLFEPYETYKQDGLGRFPLDLQHTMENLAKENLETKVLDLISRAQNFEPVEMDFAGQLQETDILMEIRNFATSAGMLNQLVTYFNDLDLVRSYQVLSDLLYWQTATLMTAFNGFLEDEDLYGIKGGDFSWWDGTAPLTTTAFGVEDEKELENYLNFQRTRISHLADEYAKPLVSFFQNTRILRNREEERILFRWERIIAELEKYQNKKPGNSVAELEKFILSELSGITVDNYFEKIPRADLPATSGDIFLQRRNEVRRLLFSRCQRLASIRIQQSYGALVAHFNDNLAGRFPFAAYSGRTLFAEADPGDIRDFYRILDVHQQTLESVLKANGEFGASGDRARAFIDEMVMVRAFFRSYIGEAPGEKTKPPAELLPTFDLDVRFRANKGKEAMANRIMDWRLTVGDQSIEKRKENKVVRWQYGTPIGLTMRWAKNAPDYPVFAGDAPGVKVRDRSISFSFDNQWSLLTMLMAHAGDSGDFDQLSDPKPHTLKFTVEAKRRGVKPHEGDRFQMRAYVRVTLLSADKAKSVQTLPVFPVRAPEIKLLKLAARPAANKE
ncbi:MAG: hypothetical protein JEZ11_04625 [Desulfobacterales bacterium]|nr:hypothetical protein [Desulfobacterales bacterium]